MMIIQKMFESLNFDDQTSESLKMYPSNQNFIDTSFIE